MPRSAGIQRAITLGVDASTLRVLAKTAAQLENGGRSTWSGHQVKISRIAEAKMLLRLRKGFRTSGSNRVPPLGLITHRAVSAPSGKTCIAIERYRMR
jgi:hypothetical protein